MDVEHVLPARLVLAGGAGQETLQVAQSAPVVHSRNFKHLPLAAPQLPVQVSVAASTSPMFLKLKNKRTKAIRRIGRIKIFFAIN